MYAESHANRSHLAGAPRDGPCLRAGWPTAHTSFLETLHPIQRLAAVSEVVDAVLYLTRAPFVTGEVLHVDVARSTPSPRETVLSRDLRALPDGTRRLEKKPVMEREIRGLAERRTRTSRPPRRPPLGGVPDYFWTPLASGVLVLVCGLLGLATGQLWLFPSIGPTAFLLAHSPEAPSAQPWNVVVGHLVGLTAGYLALAPLHVSNLPATFALHALMPVRVWASALAVTLTLFGQIVTRSSHPPAAATTLLVALGGFRATVHDASAVVVGILVVAAAGELLRFVHARAG